MVFTPYDWNQHLAHKSDYVEDRLREGSPVVAISFDEGVLLLTARKSQRKIFEIYDRLMYSAIGNQADIESIRIASIDFAHQEGYGRSPDDVTVQRLVGFAISPALKRAFNDATSGPYVLRAVFAEMCKRPEEDLFLTLNYDGEFSVLSGGAAIGGTPDHEEAMGQVLSSVSGDQTPGLGQAFEIALHAWAAGRMQTGEGDETREPTDPETRWKSFVKEALQTSVVEAAVLERDTRRDRKFKVLDTSRYLDAILGG